MREREKPPRPGHAQRISPLESPHMVAHALTYARRGLKVFPIWAPFGGACTCGEPDCENAGKHPVAELAPHGVNDATTDRARIRQWWTTKPDANIGISAENLIVIDVDKDHGGFLSLEKLETEIGKLPDTLRSDTGGGGKHHISRRNGAPCKNLQGLRPGIDLKTNGGYIVAPPSLHSSGRRYLWDATCSRTLADLPASWLNLLKDGKKESKQPAPASVLDGVAEGQRDIELFKYGCTLRRQGLSKREAKILVSTAAEKCRPPFKDWEAKVESAYREPETGIPYIEFASAFLAIEDPPVRYISNELIPEGVLVIPHGEPRTGKTWGVEDLAIAVATGTPAFGLERFAVPGPVPVLYSSQEDAAREVRIRARALLRGRGIERFPETLAFAVHKGINLQSLEWQERLIAGIKSNDFRLVIFDPIRRYAPDCDKGPGEVRTITGYLRRITVETGATVLCVHHDVKPNPQNNDERRRSHKASGGDWFAAAECPISFERAGAGSTLVVPEDYKYSVDPQPFSFKLETDDPRNPTIARLIGETTTAEDSKILALQERILTYLSEHSAGVSGSSIIKTCRIRREDGFAALDLLLKSGQVDCVGLPGKGRKQTWFLREEKANSDE
ncbi:MAG TPA: bifunctional DNA primase/polymerase [Acidobacteriota bacterium]|nr:bifunctional DNA primase/polymerase [Acidobacteriota bacterium]